MFHPRFMFFNKFKEWTTREGRIKMHPTTALVGGMLAGCFSTIGNNPFDVVKTKMQSNNGSHYAGTLDCFQQIYRFHGFAGFYAGVLPRLGRVVPGQVRDELGLISLMLY